MSSIICTTHLKRRHLLKAASCIPAAMLSNSVQAKKEPPIRIIIPFAAGANSDVLTRKIAHTITQQGGPNFIIENKPGGGGVIAAQTVRNAPADGKTLLLANISSHVVFPLLQPAASLPTSELKPVTQLFFFPNYLVVPERIPAKTVKQLIDFGHPIGLSLGTQGIGSPGHLLGAMLKQQSGLSYVHIPYPGGGGPMNADVIAGRLDMVFSTYASLKSNHDEGRVRFLAIASDQRSSSMPSIPTMAESGYPDVSLDAWFGLVAPKNTSTSLIKELNRQFQQAAQTTSLQQDFAQQGVSLKSQFPEEFEKLIADERVRIAKLINSTGIRVH